MITGTDVKPTPFLSICVPCLTTVATAALLSLMVESGRPHAGLNYTWKAVVRGRPKDE